MRGISVSDKLEPNYMYAPSHEALNNLDVYKPLFSMISNPMTASIVETGYKSWHYLILVNSTHINLEITLETLILFGKYR